LITFTDVSNVLFYLNEETINYKSSFDVISVVNIIDRIIRTTNYNTDSIQSNLYSIFDKILSLQMIQLNGSIVK
jgi:urate oxidase